MAEAVRMNHANIGDIYLFVNDTMGVEEECVVTEVHPLSMRLMTKTSGLMLDAWKGINEKQFIPIVNV